MIKQNILYKKGRTTIPTLSFLFLLSQKNLIEYITLKVLIGKPSLQKGGVPAAPSGTATLLRLSPSYRFYPRTLLYGYVLQVPPASMA